MSDSNEGSSKAARSALQDSTAKPIGFFGKILTHLKPTVQTETGQEPAGALVGMRKLNSLRVEDVAIPRADIVSVPVDLKMNALIKTFKNSGYSRLPVYDDNLDAPLGMIHMKDLALKYGFNGPPKNFSIKRLTRPVLFVPPSMPLGVLLQKMQAERTHMALVVDEYGGVDGLVTIEDLVEQLVGEIADEHDAEDDVTWVEDPEGVYICQSRTSLEEFEKVLGIDLTSDVEGEDIDTLGGLAFMMTGRVPVRGEIISHPSGFDFEILQADPRRIKKLRVSKRAK